MSILNLKYLGLYGLYILSVNLNNVKDTFRYMYV